jgi:hypothetical protein
MHRSEDDFPWLRTRRKGIALVKQVFEDAAVGGGFTVHSPDLAALMLLGGVRAVIRFGERPRPPDLARRIIAEFLHGAATLPKGRKSNGRPSVN